MEDSQDIAGILVTYFVDDVQALFIIVMSDGTINRMGTGSTVNAENILCIGQSEASLSILESLKSMIGPEFLNWFDGEYTDPAAKGLVCKLTVGLRQADGTELMSAWQYGSESRRPPPDIINFVSQAIKLTDPWYEQQKNMAAARNGDKHAE